MPDEIAANVEYLQPVPRAGSALVVSASGVAEARGLPAFLSCGDDLACLCLELEPVHAVVSEPSALLEFDRAVGWFAPLPRPPQRVRTVDCETHRLGSATRVEEGLSGA